MRSNCGCDLAKPSVYLSHLGMLCEEHVVVEPVALAVQPPLLVHRQEEIALDAPHPERARGRRRTELQYCKLVVGPGPNAAAGFTNACFEKVPPLKIENESNDRATRYI